MIPNKMETLKLENITLRRTNESLVEELKECESSKKAGILTEKQFYKYMRKLEKEKREVFRVLGWEKKLSGWLDPKRKFHYFLPHLTTVCKNVNLGKAIEENKEENHE